MQMMPKVLKVTMDREGDTVPIRGRNRYLISPFQDDEWSLKENSGSWRRTTVVTTWPITFVVCQSQRPFNYKAFMIGWQPNETV